MSLALIVDDSKTSSVVLEKMLLKHDVEAVKVDCAEDALEYLSHNQCTMIFMDHMMPGMDGFDAVKAIKSEPALADIPIVMYTSKTGEIYVGHARALGAADILTKPATDKALTEVLVRLKDRSSLSIRLPQNITEQMSELLLAPEPAQAIPESRDEGVTGVDTEFIEFTHPAGASRRKSGVTFFGIIALLCLSAFGLLEANQNSKLVEERKALHDLLAWSASQASVFNYGEMPFSNSRLLLLEGLLSRLAATGFDGEVKLVGHVGAFCLSDTLLDSGESLAVLAPPDLPVSACQRVGMGPGQAVIESQKQSDAFKGLMNSSSILRSSAIRVSLEGSGGSAPAFPYPSGDELTAAEWNAVAYKNNRVVFSIVSD